MKKTIAIIILILVTPIFIVCLSLSALDKIKEGWVKDELTRRALVELAEKQKMAKVNLADEAIQILETKINGIQKRTGETRLCQLVLMNQNVTPDVLVYRLSRCFNGGPEKFSEVWNDTLRSIKAINALDCATLANPKAPAETILDMCEQQLAQPNPAGEKVIEDLKARLREIKDMTPSIPPPAEKPASK